MTGGGYRNEDLEFKHVSGPPRYASAAGGPVQYVLVANQDGPIGYLWASDQDDAAGYEFIRSGGAPAANAGVVWYERLRSAKADGLPPSAALSRLAEDRDPVTGHIVTGSLGVAPSLAVLKDLAG